MAADVTLIALENTEENWTAAKLKTYTEYFDDDELFKNEEGEVFFVSHNAGSKRDVMFKDFYHDIDWFEVGSVSYVKASLLGDVQYLPGPTVAVHELCVEPRLCTPSFVTQVMVALNLPNDSYYKQTRKQSRRKVKRWLNEHMGMIVFSEAW